MPDIFGVLTGVADRAPARAPLPAASDDDSAFSAAYDDAARDATRDSAPAQPATTGRSQSEDQSAADPAPDGERRLPRAPKTPDKKASAAAAADAKLRTATEEPVAVDPAAALAATENAVDPAEHLVADETILVADANAPAPERETGPEVAAAALIIAPVLTASPADAPATDAADGPAGVAPLGASGPSETKTEALAPTDVPVAAPAEPAPTTDAATALEAPKAEGRASAETASIATKDGAAASLAPPSEKREAAAVATAQAAPSAHRQKHEEKKREAIGLAEHKIELLAAASDRQQVTQAAAKSTGVVFGPQTADAAAQVVAAIRAEAGSDQIDVRLDPPELGRVRISMHFERGDVVTATVSSERTDTLDLLKRHQDELTRELEKAGFARVNLQFSTGGSGQNFTQQPSMAPTERLYAADAADDVRIQYLSLRTDNRLDRLV